MSVAIAYDTFDNMSEGQGLMGRIWSSGDNTWPNNLTNQYLKSNGAGDVVDISNDDYVRAIYDLRAGDVGTAIFFRPTVDTPANFPRLILFAKPAENTNNSGISIFCDVNQKLSIGEVIESGAANAAAATVTINTPILQAGKEYCLEICLTSDPSNKVYAYRLTLVVNGERTGMLAVGTYTANNVATYRSVKIFPQGRAVSISPISRVETFNTPFTTQWGAGIPTDDGTTVTSIIGSTNDCHFKSIPEWWAWMPSSLVAQNRSHVGLVDKTMELTHSAQVVLGGKVTDATRNILLTARPGHAYYEHPDFWTKELRYNPNRGAALLWDLAYAEALSITQDWMIVRGLQIQNKVGPYASGAALSMTAANSSLQLSLVYTPGINHTYGFNSIFGGNASKHFGNFFVLGSPSAVSLGSSKIQFENCSFIATSDSGADVSTVGLTMWDDTVLKNCAFFGLKSPYSPGGNRAQVINCISDKTFPSPSGNPVMRGNIESVVFADQIMNTVKATLDLRTKPGSQMYNAGETPSVWNNLAPGGSRVKEGVVDIGAYEANRATPTKFVITGSTAVTIGYSVNVRIALDTALAGGETQTVTPTDGAGGTFVPASYTLTASEGFKVFAYTPAATLGSRTVTATNTSGTYNIATTTAAYTVKAPDPATKLILSGLTSISLGESSTFTLSSDNPPIDDQVFNFALSSNISCLFEPASGTLTKTKTEQEIKFTPNAVGSLTVTATPSGSLNLPVLTAQTTVKPKPPTFVTGNNYYEIGIGHQFTNLKAFATWIADKDLVAMKANAYVYFFNDESSDAEVYPLASSELYNIYYSPAAGFGFKDTATSNLYGYPNAGIELAPTGVRLAFSQGSTIEGFRIRCTDSPLVLHYNPGSGGNAAASVSKFQRNRVLVNRTNSNAALLTGERACSAHVRDNFFLATKPGIVFSFRDSSGDVSGNTLVATGDAVNNASFSTDAYGGNTGNYQNNVFWNCGNSPWSIVEGNPNEEGRITATRFKNNFTNIAIDAAKPHQKIGFTVNTATAFFKDVANGDYRASKTGPLYGTATALAVSTNDAAGANRGYSPDAGAFQLEPATTLGIVTATSQKMAGNRLSLEMSLLNPITTLTVVLPIDSTNPGGAVQQGPYNVTMANGVGTVVVDGIPVGNYGKPILEATNAGGSSYGTGFNSVKVAPIKTNAGFSEFIGVADGVVSYGKPTLPIYAVGAPDKKAAKPLLVDLAVSKGYVIAAGNVDFTPDITTEREIEKVEFYYGATLVSTQTVKPYLYTVAVNTGTVPNGTYSVSVKVYDAYGSTPVTASAGFSVNIPTASATVPTVVSATSINPENAYDVAKMKLVFSEAMDTAKDFDFGSQANYHLSNHNVTGATWLNSTTLQVTVDSYFPLKQCETLKLSYRKNDKTGWRSAAGVLVESFDDMAVTNNVTDAVFPNLTQSTKGLGASIGLAGKTFTTGTAVWEATTLFTTNAQGAVIPADASTGPRINGGVFAPGVITVNNTTYTQRGLSVSFKLNSASDSPYGIVIGSNSNVNTGFGATYVRAEVSKAGVLSFEHVSTAKKPNVYPNQQLPVLDVGVEYTLRLAHTDDGCNTLYVVQLWKSTAGVLNTLVAAYSYQINQQLDDRFYKVYTTNVNGPYASLEAMIGQTNHIGGDRIVGDVTYSVPALVGNNNGVVVTTDGDGYLALTGNGNSGSNAASIVLNRLFLTTTAESATSDAGFQVTIGNVVNNIRLGGVVSKVKNQVAQPVAADQYLFAIEAPSIGAAYKVYMGNTDRLPNRKVLVAVGDLVRARLVNNDVVLDVKKANGDVLVLYRVRYITGRLSNYLSAQFILPGNSTVNKVKY